MEEEGVMQTNGPNYVLRDLRRALKGATIGEPTKNATTTAVRLYFETPAEAKIVREILAKIKS